MNTAAVNQLLKGKNRRHAGLKERYVYSMVDLTFGQRRGVIKNVGSALKYAFIRQSTFSSLPIQLEINAR